MHTLETLIGAHGVDVLDHLDRDGIVPVTDQPQIQGDVSVLPVTTAPATTLIPKAGVVAVAAETSAGNTHTVLGDGFYDRHDARSLDDLTVGTLTVPEGGEAYIAHPEHGFVGIAPGTYRVGRQREWAGEWRRVAD